MGDWYTLADDGKTPVPAPDIEDRQGFKAATDRDRHPGWIVGKTAVGDYDVSTVFLFLDHGYDSDVPVLWETLVFASGHPMDQDGERYTSWEDAKAGHERYVAQLRDHPWISRNDLLTRLQGLAGSGDPESAHSAADDLLLRHIDDVDIREAFDAIEKWYA